MEGAAVGFPIPRSKSLRGHQGPTLLGQRVSLLRVTIHFLLVLMSGAVCGLTTIVPPSKVGCMWPPFPSLVRLEVFVPLELTPLLFALQEHIQLPGPLRAQRAQLEHTLLLVTPLAHRALLGIHLILEQLLV